MRPRFRASLAALVLLAASACSDSTAPIRLPEGRRVLFIGNSLTTWNAMPEMVDAFARVSQVEPPFVGYLLTADGYSLADHWNDGSQEIIRQAEWDIVIMQQGPSALPENRVLLREYAAHFAGEIRAIGALPALLSVWPSESRMYDFPTSIESYRLAAEDVDGLFIPAASAWLEAWNRDPSLQLYSDDVHPSMAGSYLTALVVFGRLYERSPVGLPTDLDLMGGGSVEIDPAIAATLQAAAAAALGY